jgi:hypothetical protein
VHRLGHACLPGSFLVDIFPVLKHLPATIAPWKKEGMEWYRKDTAMFQKFMDQVESQVVSIILFNSFTRTNNFDGNRKPEKQNQALLLGSSRARRRTSSVRTKLHGWQAQCCTCSLSHESSILPISLCI